MLWIYILISVIVFIYNPIFILFGVGFVVIYFNLIPSSDFTSWLKSSGVPRKHSFEKEEKPEKKNNRYMNNNYAELLDEFPVPERTDKVDCIFYDEN